MLALSGCALPVPARYAEGTYQVLAAIDYTQTSAIARRPDCMVERGGAEAFIGEKPSQTKVSAYFAMGAVGHVAVSSWLARQADATGAKGWYWALAGWEIGSIALEAETIAGNFRRGVEPFGHGLTQLCNRR
jgi:hypothetical protein